VTCDTLAVIDPKQVAERIAGYVMRAAERAGDVGGIYEAYEKAFHWALLVELLRNPMCPTDRAQLEWALGNGEHCDVFVPLVGGARLWLEVKHWWFLDGYRSGAKVRHWSVGDMLKLEESDRVGDGDFMAVMLVRAWQREVPSVATAWMTGLSAAHPEGLGAPTHTALLPPFAPMQYGGDLHLWVKRRVAKQT